MNGDSGHAALHLPTTAERMRWRIDPVALAQALVRCPSVTPADEGVLDLIEAALRGIGFRIERLRFGTAPDGPVDNLFAWAGSGRPHLAFAGHSDVVPAGPSGAWTSAPFGGEIVDGRLVGRGAADMKGAIAAFIAAAERHLGSGNAARPGTLSLVITGDEEGPATFGTAKLLEWMEARGHVPDAALVGEPTCAAVLGDAVKIGRRGSLNAWITVRGRTGHVAYPALTDNPVARLVRALHRLQETPLDAGTEWFDPSNLEVTDVSVGNAAVNVVPAEARARLNIRYNDGHSGESLHRWIAGVLAEEAPDHDLEVRISGDAFLTEPGELSGMVAGAVQAATGLAPKLSTSGGTSDARFIRRLCPVVEFGLVGATMHKPDEAVPVGDIERLAGIYTDVLARFFGSSAET